VGIWREGSSATSGSGSNSQSGKTRTSSSLFSSYRRADPNNSSLTGDDHTFNIYSVGAAYNFTKRTNLYAYASYADNYAFQGGVTSTAFAVGIRHKF
jgi:GBP family porin